MAAAVRAVIPMAGGTFFGVKYATDPSFNAFVSNLIPNALSALKVDAAPAVAGAAAVVSKVDDLHTAALTASVRAMESMLRENRSGSSMRFWLLLATPAALAFAIRHYGWAHLGWATPEELQAKLEDLREKLTERVQQLSDEMHKRFGLVDKKLDEANGNVSAMRGELKDGLHAVDASVEKLDGRIAPIEKDLQRTVEGVGLLCEFVATSSGSSNASPELMGRLEEFTGLASGALTPKSPRLSLLGAPPAEPAPVVPAQAKFPGVLAAIAAP